MSRSITTLDAVLNIPVDENLRDEVRSLAQAEQRKPAQMGRLLLREAIEARRAAGLSASTNGVSRQPTEEAADTASTDSSRSAQGAASAA